MVSPVKACDHDRVAPCILLQFIIRESTPNNATFRYPVPLCLASSDTLSASDPVSSSLSWSLLARITAPAVATNATVPLEWLQSSYPTTRKQIHAPLGSAPASVMFSRLCHYPISLSSHLAYDNTLHYITLFPAKLQLKSRFFRPICPSMSCSWNTTTTIEEVFYNFVLICVSQILASRSYIRELVSDMASCSLTDIPWYSLPAESPRSLSESGKHLGLSA